jgi:hypothetical protein
MSISNHILSDIFILSVFESESGHKYENKYDISDIRLYPIRFHPYPTGPTDYVPLTISFSLVI